MADQDPTDQTRQNACNSNMRSSSHVAWPLRCAPKVTALESKRTIYLPEPERIMRHQLEAYNIPNERLHLAGGLGQVAVSSELQILADQCVREGAW